MLVFSPPSTNWNIPQSTSGSPVPLAIFTKVAGLIDIVIIVITELGIKAVTARTCHHLVWFLKALVIQRILTTFPKLPQLI
jgi:hypothetical protein